MTRSFAEKRSKTEDFGQVLMSLTEGMGLNVILDMVGGDYVRREIDALAHDGRLLLIALMAVFHKHDGQAASADRLHRPPEAIVNLWQ